MTDSNIQVRITNGFTTTAKEFREICESLGASEAAIVRKLIEIFVEKNRGKKLDFEFNLPSLELPATS